MKTNKKNIITYFLIGAFVAVLLVSISQTFALTELQQTIANQASTIASATSNVAPTMVGGC